MLSRATRHISGTWIIFSSSFRDAMIISFAMKQCMHQNAMMKSELLLIHSSLEPVHCHGVAPSGGLQGCSAKHGATSLDTFVCSQTNNDRDVFSCYFNVPIVPHSMNVNGREFHNLTADWRNVHCEVLSLGRLIYSSSIEDDLRSLTGL